MDPFRSRQRILNAIWAEASRRRRSFNQERNRVEETDLFNNASLWASLEFGLTEGNRHGRRSVVNPGQRPHSNDSGDYALS